MLRSSWEACQQLGLPESLTKPTNPSRADRWGQGGGGWQSPLLFPGIPSEVAGATRNSLANASLVGGSWEVKKGQARGWVCLD